MHIEIETHLLAAKKFGPGESLFVRPWRTEKDFENPKLMCVHSKTLSCLH